MLPPPRIEVTSEDSNRKTGDDEYEDDFDKELDSFIESEEKSDDDRHQDQHTETTPVNITVLYLHHDHSLTWSGAGVSL